jgi:hypothetical protein
VLAYWLDFIRFLTFFRLWRESLERDVLLWLLGRGWLGKGGNKVAPKPQAAPDTSTAIQVTCKPWRKERVASLTAPMSGGEIMSPRMCCTCVQIAE